MIISILKYCYNDDYTYVFDSDCELLQASFLNLTIENNENTENENMNIIP